MGVPRSGKAFFSFDAFRILDYLPIITSHKNILGRADEVCLEIESIQDLLDNVFFQFSAIRVGSHLTAFRVAWKHLVNEDDALPYLDAACHRFFPSKIISELFIIIKGQHATAFSHQKSPLGCLEPLRASVSPLFLPKRVL